MPKWLFLLVQLKQRLWLTVALYSGLGLMAALLATVFGRYVPSDFPLKLGSDSVDDILTILASSMLAVATFSLTTLVTAYTSVVSAVAPHAAKLLVSDKSIRSALATFVGAFIYSIVGIVALHTGFYGAQGRVILFFITLFVLLLVVLAMLRWIGQLSSLAQVDNVIDRVAGAASDALRARATVSAWQGRDYQPPDDAVAVKSEQVGFVRNIDLEGLEDVAEDIGAVIYVEATPGVFVHPAQPLFHIAGPQTLSTELVGRLRSKVTIGARRTFDQDPRFGLTVLGEIAGRALSPGINDPGTAKDVVSSTVWLLNDWIQDMAQPDQDLPAPSVRLRPVDPLELITDAWGPVVRHGAKFTDLQVALHNALLALASAGNPELAEAARRFSLDALDRTAELHPHEDDRRLVVDEAARVQVRPI